MRNESAGASSHVTTEKDAPKGASTQPSDHKQAAKDVAKEAGTKASQVKDKVVEESAHAREELQRRASGFFSDFRGAVADQIDRITEALRGSEREMKKQNLDEIATYPAVLAKHIEDVNEYLRDRSGRGMRRDFERAIAAQPVAVIGGLAAVGALTAWYLRRDRAGNGRTGMSTSGGTGGRRSRTTQHRSGSGSERSGEPERNRTEAGGSASHRSQSMRSGNDSGADRAESRKSEDGDASGSETRKGGEQRGRA